MYMSGFKVIYFQVSGIHKQEQKKDYQTVSVVQRNMEIQHIVQEEFMIRPRKLFQIIITIG